MRTELRRRAPTALIGRARQVDALTAALDETRAGHARGLILRGAPGVGKTRLLQEATAKAEAEGLRVATSGCLPLTTSLPFDPVLELLRSLGDPLPAAATASPHELFGMVVDTLERATVEGPLLLCLDDLQWSDAGTLDLVQYCLARLVDLPIAWMLAARPEKAVDLVVHRLSRTGAVEPLELEALSASEIGLLAAAILGVERVSDRFVDALYARTGGNPFLCEELLRALPDAPVDENADVEIGQLVPASVSDSITERVAQLPTDARDALRWAAVLPEPFTFEELEAVAGAELRDALEPLAAASLLAWDGDRQWTFVHSMTRDAIYQHLPELERVRRHAAVADALSDQPLERRAPQLAAARRWHDAAGAYLQVARTAFDRGRGRDAAALYERAGSLAAHGGDERLRREAHAGEVLALVRAGEVEQAKQTAGALQAELRRGEWAEERLAFLARYASTLIENALDLRHAEELLHEAESLLGGAEGSALAEVLTVRAYVRCRTGDNAGALPDAQRAVELAEAMDDPVLLARALTTSGVVHGNAHGTHRGRIALERALAVARAADLPAQEARARVHLSYLAGIGDDTEAVEAHALAGLQLDGVPAAQAVVLRSNLGTARLQAGDLDGALAHQLAALREAARLGPQAQAPTAIALGFVYLWRGDLSAVRRLLSEHDATFAVGGARIAAELRGRLLEAEGNPEEAYAYFQMVDSREDDPIVPYFLVGRARTAAAIGRLPDARDALAALETLAPRWPISAWMRDEARGWVAVGEGRTGDAPAQFHAAAARCNDRCEATRLAFEAARIEEDRPQIRAAIDAFEELGAIQAADRARAVARSLGMRPGRRRTGGGGLSAREQEITHLIAAGRTNAEIAAALYLSRRTVEHYVSNILTKLGYRARAQIAADAAAGRLPTSPPELAG